MNKLTILGPAVRKEGDFKNDQGEAISFETFKQPARLEINGFAYPLDVRIEKGQKEWPAGHYTLDLDSMLQVNKGVGTLAKFHVLKPLAAAPAK